MKRKLSPWCKQVQKTMIDLDMSTTDLAKKVGGSRTYVSAVVHGRIYAEPLMEKISATLNIQETSSSLM